MRVNQIWQWVYHWGVRDFDAMTNLVKRLIVRLLADNVSRIAVPEVVSRQVSDDGTRKYLVRIAGGHEVETVVYSRKKIAARSASPARSDARSPVPSAIPARRNWCAT